MKSESILIVSHYYKHKNAMASVRAVKLAKYFDLLGCKVTVLCSMQRDEWCRQNTVPVPSESIREIYVPEAPVIALIYNFYARLKHRGEKRAEKLEITDEQKSSVLSRFQKSLKGFLSWLFYFGTELLENHILYKSYLRAYKANRLGGFDFAIATYPGAAAHLFGIWLKRNRKCGQFIADYRDPAYNPGARSRIFEAWHDRKMQQKTLKYADKAVCVSYGMAEDLQKHSIRCPPVFVVHNGYDPDDYMTGYDAGFDFEKVNFVYTGTLYHGRRCVDVLASVLRSLIDEGKITQDSFRFEYAGPDFPELVSQLNATRLAHTAHDNGYVTRECSLCMQKSADALLFLNWNDKNYRGVIPGKLYEYLASGVPVLALITGNEAGSESGEMIRKCGCGMVYEQANGSLLELKAYVINLFNTKQHGYIAREQNKGAERYSYQNITWEYLKCLRTET